MLRPEGNQSRGSKRPHTALAGTSESHIPPVATSRLASAAKVWDDSSEDEQTPAGVPGSQID